MLSPLALAGVFAMELILVGLINKYNSRTDKNIGAPTVSCQNSYKIKGAL